MKKSKFYDFPTQQGNIAVNINHITSIEDLTNGTKIIMNIKDKNGQYLSYVASLPWSSVVAEIKFQDENQN